MARRSSSMETSIKPSTNFISRNQVEKSKQISQVKNTKNKIQQKSDKQKLRKETENTKRKAATKTMKKSKSISFTSIELDDFNPSKNEDKETVIKEKWRNGETLITVQKNAPILSKSLSNINYSALEDEDCKEIAKNMMDSNKHSLQRFKKAVNYKGVPDEDSYQEM